MAGDSLESLARVPGIAGTQFEIKIKPPRQAQEWSYSSHRESIGKALSSPGIRSNKKAHINCGSSARMAGNGRVFYIARAALNPPTSIRKKLFPVIGEWHDRMAAKKLCLGDPIQPTVAENACVQVIMMLQEDFYTRLGAHGGTPFLLSHLATFNLL
ncbi:hypothetical protein [Absidia glauca]|uniref:Ndc10 domain-containing protein n=1 Tax=Absidia glauca TaxID=4829 RepID=A0A168RJ38_ABSGL|nr:hypothetical protein [Absidia glauca]